MDKARELELEIQEKQRELEELKNKKKKGVRDEAIKTIDEYTDEEKIKVFEGLHGWMMSLLEEKETEGYIDDDTEHYAYESLLGLIAKDDMKFWKYWNSL